MQFPILRPGLSYDVTISGTAAASTNVVSATCNTLRLVATSATWVSIGVSPVATATTSVYLPAGVPEYFRCSANGTEKVSGLQVSAGGTLNITEMTS